MEYAINDPYEEGNEIEKEVLGLLCERRDPYGFWYVKKPGKSKHLQGAFTTLDQLKVAINASRNDTPPPKKVLTTLTANTESV